MINVINIYKRINLCPSIYYILFFVFIIQQINITNRHFRKIIFFLIVIHKMIFFNYNNYGYLFGRYKYIFNFKSYSHFDKMITFSLHLKFNI